MNFLVKFGLLPAEAYDFVFPHGPRFSVYTKEYAMAGVVRDIAGNISDKAAQKKLLAAGKTMVEFSAKGLVNGWEEGDDICPPWWPFPWRGNGGDPQPNPWYTRVEGIAEYANALKVLAGLTAVPSVAKQLKEIADTVGRQG